jgi:dihydroorotate dehydrogenase
VIGWIYELTRGRLPIIGVGGIFSAEDAFEKIAAGSVLIQAYTGFVYAGPSFAGDINRGLVSLLRDRGFKTLDDAVGSALR